MSRRVTVMSHKGHQIIYGDYSGTQGQDFLDVIQAQETQSLMSPTKDLLHLLNFTDCNMSSQARQRSDQMMAALTSKGYSVKTAAFGATGIQRIIANAVKKDVFFAKTMDEAKEWLVQQE